MGKKRTLPPLSPRGRELMSPVLNSVAFQTHDEQGELEARPVALGQARGLRPTLHKLKGQVAINEASDKSVTSTSPSDRPPA